MKQVNLIQDRFIKWGALVLVLVFFLGAINDPVNAEERSDIKHKSTLADTLRHTDRPGRELDQQPERVIAFLGVKPGDSICDIGAGTGFFSFRIAEIVGDKGKVFAVDIEQDMIDYIKNKMADTATKNIIPIKSQENDPRLPASACDKVLIVNTYRLFLTPVTIMKNIQAALKTGADIAIIDFSKDRTIPGPPYEQRVGQDEVISQMHQAGYKLTRSYDFLKRQYFLVFQKEN